MFTLIPIGGEAGLRSFDVPLRPGTDIVVGRGATTGITKMICSRAQGRLWVSSGGALKFQSTSAAASYVRPAGHSEFRAVPKDDVLDLAEGEGAVETRASLPCSCSVSS